MTDIRAQAIALLVEKLREIESDANRTYEQCNERLAVRPIAMTFESYNDYLDARNLNYALAYRCEQLAEAITGALLFDQLDADEEAAAVRSIERDMAVEAGDDHDPASCFECSPADPSVIRCTRCGNYGHGTNDCEAEL